VLFIDPVSTMNFMMSLMITLVVILGGMGTLWGPIIGAFVLIPITELTRVYWGGAGQAIDLIIYGALIVIIAIYQPRGLVSMVERYRRKLRYGSTAGSD
jgi:branched-chain amino acid transport system permease protein